MSTVHLELAHAKLTRTLEVTGLRADGYHLLASEMVSVSLADEVRITEDAEGLEVLDEIDWAGIDRYRPVLEVPLDSTNLVLRALALVGRKAAVTLTKHIPAGAGLGGGSSDAGAVLRHFGLEDPALAARLGADVPFCVRGGRALVGGVGELLEPLEDLDLGFVLVTPSYGVSTKAVYDAYDLLGPGRDRAGNDLEAAALAVEPRLIALREAIGDETGERPRLAGSGSTYFVECSPADAPSLAGRLQAALGGSQGPVLISACRTAVRPGG